MIISAYVSVGGFKDGFRPGDTERLTHINWAFAVVKEGRGSVDHWKNGDAVRAFNKTKGHLKSILSVGGWGAGGFSNACLTPEGRELLAQSLVDIANDYGFDGIDMDWEYPGVSAAGIDASPEHDKQNFVELIRLLREKQKPGAIVSMAAGTTTKIIEHLDFPELLKYMDFINLMTYDLCPWDRVGYHTALAQAAEGVARFVDAGWPAARLTLGAAFYGRIYKDCDGYGAPISQGSIPGWISYTKIKERGHGPGYNQYDETAQTAFFYDTTTREFASYDNPRSLAAKVAYVQENALAGLMFWEYSYDTPDSELVRAISGKE